ARSLRELLRRLWSRRIDGEALTDSTTLNNPRIPKSPNRNPFTMELPSTKDFQWKSLAPLPSRRVYSTLVEAAGQVFAVGGCDDNGVPVDSFEVYSPEADQWASLPPMPTARAGVAVTVLGKRIMVIGGVGTNQQPLKVVEMYNTDEGRWRKRSSLREAAMGISVTAKGKEGPGGVSGKDYRVYAAGGMGSDLRPHNFLQHYDVLKDIWVSLAAMPTPRYAATSILRGSKIYVLGGWLKMERSCFLKKRRADFVAGYLRGRVVVAGGLGNQPTVLESAEAFHPDKNKWENLPPMPTPRCACSCIALRDCLLAVGGVSQGLSTAVEALCLSDS
ncbi:hypothetical protein Nmel_017798, partial [Mimus melanotis]